MTIDYLLWLTKKGKAGLFDNPVGVILLIGIDNDLQYIATLPEFREKYIKGDILSLFSDDGSCIVEAKTALGKRMIAVEDPSLEEEAIRNDSQLIVTIVWGEKNLFFLCSTKEVR